MRFASQAVSELHHALDCFEAFELVRHEEALVDVRDGWHVIAANTFDWRLQV